MSLKAILEELEENSEELEKREIKKERYKYLQLREAELEDLLKHADTLK